MAHVSRLGQALARQELHCIICGCSEDDGCVLENNQPCSWVSPGLCSNPACIAEFNGEPIEDVDAVEEEVLEEWIE